MLSHPFQVSEVIIEFSSFSPSNFFTHHLERQTEGRSTRRAGEGDREGGRGRDMFLFRQVYDGEQRSQPDKQPPPSRDLNPSPSQQLQQMWTSLLACPRGQIIRLTCDAVTPASSSPTTSDRKWSLLSSF